MIFLCNFMTFLHIEKYTLTYIITHEVYNEKIIIIFNYTYYFYYGGICSVSKK